MESDDPDLRKLVLKLTEKNFVYDVDTKQVGSESMITNFLSAPAQRDRLIKIGRFYE